MASFHGSGISDLRSAVASQQQQIEGLVDKVALLLSAMHAEVLRDVRATAEQENTVVVAQIQQLRHTEGEVDQRFAALREREEELRRRVDSEVKELRDRIGRELQGLIREGGLVGEMRGLGDRLLQLEEKEAAASGRWQAIVEDAVHEAGTELRLELREELLRDLHGRHDGTLAARLRALEERLLASERLPPISTEAVEVAEYRERFEDLERSTAAQGVALDRVREGVQQQLLCLKDEMLQVSRLGRAFDELRGRVEAVAAATAAATAAAAPALDEPLSEWYRGVEEAEARLEKLEQWQLSCEEQLRRRGDDAPLRAHVASNEQQLHDVQERVESLAASVHEARRGLQGGGGAANSAASSQRLDSLQEQVASLQTTTHQELRTMSQRVAQLGKLEPSVRSMEALVETTHKQFVSQSLGASAEELRQELDRRISQLQTSTQHLIEEAEGRMEQQLNMKVSQTHSLAQRMMGETRRELETDASRARSASQQLSAELRRDFSRLREEAMAGISELRVACPQPGSDVDVVALEARFGQLRGSQQRVEDQLREAFANLATIHGVLQGADLGDLRTEAEQARSRAEEAQRAVRRLEEAQEQRRDRFQRALRQELQDLATQAAGEAAADTASKLLEERCSQEIASRANAMEARIRTFLTDCQKQQQQVQDSTMNLATTASPASWLPSAAPLASPTLAGTSATATPAQGLPSVPPLPGLQSVARRGAPSTRQREEELSATIASLFDPSVAAGAGPLVEALAGRMSGQERELESLRELQKSLQDSVDAVLLEQRVSRSLAGLEERRAQCQECGAQRGDPPVLFKSGRTLE